MDDHNPFAKDWRDCLEAHFVHVIRTHDHVTEPTLAHVLKQTGFSETQLAELKVRATMHVDDVPGDFVPDLAILDEAPAQPEARIFAVPEMPTQVAEPVDDPETPELELLAPDEPVDDEPPVAEVEDESPSDDPEPPAENPDAPQQLSLF